MQVSPRQSPTVCVSVCVYTYACGSCMCVHGHPCGVYVCAPVCICTHVRANVWAHVYLCMCVHSHTRVCLGTHVYLCSPVCTCVCTHVRGTEEQEEGECNHAGTSALH